MVPQQMNGVNVLLREESGPERVRALVIDDFSLMTETLMDAPWEYNARVYEIWAMFDNWPEACLFHMSGPSEFGVTIQAVWASSKHERTYMGKVGIERYTEVARVMTSEGTAPSVDLLPNNHPLTHLSLGPLAANFIDIGADLDGAVGRQFGGQITAVDVQIPALGKAELDAFWEALDLVESADPESIVRVQFAGESGPRDTLLWTTEQAARRFVDAELLPAVAEIGGPRAVLEIRPVVRLAIGSSALDPARFQSI